MTPSKRSLTGILSTALVFGAGVALAGPVRGALTNVRERVIENPAAYQQSGVCRFDALSDEGKAAMAVRALEEQPSILGMYARRVGSRAWNELLYTTTMLAKEEK